MATFLDIGLFEHFGIVFVVLIVFLILFGLLEVVKAFGEGKRGLHAIIALAVALLFLASRAATAMVSVMVPWFLVLVIFIFFSLFIVRMFNHTDADIKKLLGDSNVYPWVIALIALILILGLSTVFGQGLLERGSGKAPAPADTNYTGSTGLAGDYTGTPLETTSTATPSFSTNLLNTLRHPKVMGMLFVFLVGMFTLLFLTRSPISL